MSQKEINPHTVNDTPPESSTAPSVPSFVENDSRPTAAKDSLAKLERTLHAEIRRRVEYSKAQHENTDTICRKIDTSVEDILTEKLSPLEQKLTELSLRLTSLEDDLSTQKTNWKEHCFVEGNKLSEDTTQLRERAATLEEAHIEAEAKHNTDLESLRTSLAKNASNEAEKRDDAFDKLRTWLEESERANIEQEVKFQNFILNEIVAIKKGIAEEANCRKQADEALLNVVDLYGKSLADTLTLLNIKE